MTTLKRTLYAALITSSWRRLLRSIVNTREEAIKDGHRPCKVYKP